MTIYIIIGVIVLFGLWVMGAYNGFVKLKNSIEEAFSTMDVYMKKRYDLIPNLVETVKGYAKHESETFEKVVAARNVAAGATSTQDKIAGENMLTQSLRSLFAVAEAYPELKANQNFMDLQGQLNTIENDIASSRKYYNAVVRDYNTKRESFPSSIVAGMFHFDKREMFEIAAEQRGECEGAILNPSDLGERYHEKTHFAVDSHSCAPMRAVCPDDRFGIGCKRLFSRLPVL